MEFSINTNHVLLEQQNQVESGEYNVTECSFIFSSEYEGLTKKAVFTGEDGIAYLQTIVDNKCSIPSEILATSQVVQIGVYAYAVENEELILRYSPEPTNFTIHEGSYKEAQNSTPPTPSEIEQLQSQITQNANDIEEIQSDVVDINTDITNIKTEQTEQNTNIQNNTDDITELQNTKADKSEIPTKTSDLINDSDFVSDSNYVHTDNNFTNEDKGQIKTNKDDISTINGNIQNINASINDINQNIDDLEQDLTNYSLITETGSQIELNINSSDFKFKAILKDKNGNTIYTSNIIDLPLETMVVGASYDNTTKEVVLTLQNGTTVRFSVADLVSGLVSTDELTQVLSNYYNKTEVNNLLANHYTKSETDTLLNEKANQTSLDTTNQNVTNLTGRVLTNEEDIADIKEEQTTQNTNIEELQSQVETLQEDLESANAEIEELNTDITNMRKAMLQVEGQGSDITLQNTSENKFVELGLEGRTEQEQLSGKNLFDGNFAKKYIDQATGQPTSYEMPNYRATENYIELKANIEYIASRQDTAKGLILYYYEKNGDFISASADSQSNTKTTRLYDRDVLLKVVLMNCENDKDYTLQLEEGSAATSYEPYCGGIPSPNPDYPQQIKNVTGNANVKIQNKNLAWNGWAEDFVSRINNNYLARLETKDNRNCLKYNASAGYQDYDNKYIFKRQFKENTQYTVAFDINSQAANGNFSIRYTDGTDTVPTISANSWQKVILTSLPNKTIKYITAWYAQGDTWIDLDTFMVLEGVYAAETIPEYVPHQKQNLPVTLGNIELCKIVNYQDYFYKENGKWYLHKEILKKVYNGTENWELNGTYNCPSIRFGEVLNKKAENSLSNYFIEKSAQLLATEYGMYTKYSGILFVGFPNATITEFKTWLSIHNLILYIGTDTPINTEITDTTLIEQLEATLQAKSYDDITYITSESDELGFNMNVVAVADANKVIDSLDTRLLALESEV